MKCPVDDSTLVMSERQGVEIDYCPDCRGVWLDRGELDKIIRRFDDDEYGDRSSRGDDRHLDRDRGRRRDDDHDGGWRRGGHRKKRKSFLSEMFELDD